jgi:hypothetical protein
LTPETYLGYTSRWWWLGLPSPAFESHQSDDSDSTVRVERYTKGSHVFKELEEMEMIDGLVKVAFELLVIGIGMVALASCSAIFTVAVP